MVILQFHLRNFHGLEFSSWLSPASAGLESSDPSGVFTSSSGVPTTFTSNVADLPTPAGPARINNLGEEYPPGSGARPVALLSHALTRSTVFG